MNKVDAGHHLEQFAAQVRCRAVAGRCHVDLARTSLGVGDEFGDRFRRHSQIARHDERRADDTRNRRNIPREIKCEIRIERRVDGVARRGEEQRIAVRRRSYDGLRCHIAAGARAVFNNQFLADAFRYLLPQQARDHVWPAPGRKAHHETHWPGRIIERRCAARCKRECGGRRCQMQELSTLNPHRDAPLY